MYYMLPVAEGSDPLVTIVVCFDGSSDLLLWPCPQVMKFCNESKSQRGMKRIQVEAKAATNGTNTV